MQAAYYLDNLYPLQDKIFSIFEKLDTPFYLTGGTALSRFYLHHRYSDDLDFFVNNLSDFKKICEQIQNVLKLTFGASYEAGLLSETFNRLLINTDSCILKIDLVNDVEYHFGEFSSHKLFSKIDNPYNIISNKICALSRNNAKDVADILLLSQNFCFDWEKIIFASKEKDTWVNPLDASSMLDSFPVMLFDEIRWINKPDYNKASILIKQIARDILLGNENSLCKK